MKKFKRIPLVKLHQAEGRFATELKVRMHEMGFTHAAQLAAKIGVSREHVRKLLSNETQPSKPLTKVIANVLGINEDALWAFAQEDRLKRKFANAPKYLPKPVITATGVTEVGIVSIGSCDGAIREALDVLARQKIGVDYLRVKAFPFNIDVEAFLKSHATIFVVEQNRDAQLKSLLTLETAVEKSKLYSILSYSGFPMSAEPIVNGIRAKLAEAPRLTAVPRKS